MTSLELVQAKWIELFDHLRSDLKFKNQIAAPFLSVPATEGRSILYVGKATAKDWYRNDTAFGPPCPSDGEAVNTRIKERRECTKEFVQKEAPKYNSGFWQFARELNTEAAKKWKLPPRTPLQHIAWTNICKIGALKGNPSGLLFRMQRDLAVETLRQEIKIYKPQLVLFVTWDYGWDLVKAVFGDSTDKAWDQTGNEDLVWRRAVADELPPALLTGHPERKRQELRRKWLNQISELLPE